MSEQMNIQWYPGHMTKTRRMSEADLKQVDAVCELLDARIPAASRNPDVASVCGSKPRLVVLNRTDLADPEQTRRWMDWFRSQGLQTVATDCRSGKGVSGFVPAVQRLLSQKLASYAAKGQTGRALKIMIVGIPNVGKSTLINQLAGGQRAKAENRPGVTRGKQWINVGRNLLLLDTPGILWPKFEDPEVGVSLAATGAVKDQVYDVEELACYLMQRLWKNYPDAVRQRYKVDLAPDAAGWELLEAAARKRGFLMSGGVLNTERMAHTLLEEYRSGKLGRFTFELPPEPEQKQEAQDAD